MVVHSPETPAIATLATEAGFDVTMVTRARPAVSESLQAGFVSAESLYDLAPVSGALVVLGDQPLVTVDTISALTAIARPGALARPVYADTPDAPGHPVFVGRTHWPLVGRAAGDRGLDPIVAAAGLRWTLVERPGANPDVDTEDDLTGLDHPRDG